MANCLDKVLCENSFGCGITILDTNGNPIDPLNLNGGESLIFVLTEKPGYRFDGWVDDSGNRHSYQSLGDNKYLIKNIDCNNQYIARYCAILYSVSRESNSDCFQPRISQHFYGDVVRISAQDSSRCRFLYWEKDGVRYSEEHSFEYVVTGNVVFRAIYDDIKYMITVEPEQRNRGICNGGGVYDFNDSVQISATPNYGYFFERWDDGIRNQLRTITVRNNKIYKAIFGANENVIYIPPINGGDVIGGGTYETGAMVSVQAVSQPGYKFTHWMIGDERNEESTVNFIADKDITLIPYFEKLRYAISFVASPQGSGTFNVNNQATYFYGDTLTVTAIPYANYTFVGWADGFSSATRDITVNSNYEYVAYFTHKPTICQVVVVLNDGTNCSIYVGGKNIAQKMATTVVANVPSGTQISMMPLAPNGKKLSLVEDSNGAVIWTDTGEPRQPVITYLVEDDVAFELYFTDIEYQMLVSLNPINGTTSGEIPLSVSIGNTPDTFIPSTLQPKKIYNGILYWADITLSAPSNYSNYSFSYWLTNQGSFETPSIHLNATNNLNCIAVFSEQ